MSPGFLKLILSKKKHFAHMVLIEKHCFEGENLLLLLLLDFSKSNNSKLFIAKSKIRLW